MSFALILFGHYLFTMREIGDKFLYEISVYIS